MTVFHTAQPSVMVLKMIFLYNRRMKIHPTVHPLRKRRRGGGLWHATPPTTVTFKSSGYIFRVVFYGLPYL